MSTSASTTSIDFLRQSYPSAISSNTSEADIAHISNTIFPNTTYTDNEKVETTQWLTTSSRLATPDEDEAKHAERLGSLNIHLSTRTTLLGTKPSVADIALYFRLAPALKNWTAEERTGEHGYHNIVRFIDFVQNAPLFGLSLKAEDKVEIDVDQVKFIRKPVDPKEEKERKKKEKAAVTASVHEGNDRTSLPIGKSKNQAGIKSNKAAAPATPEPFTENPQPPISTPNPTSSKKEKREKPAKTPKAPAAEQPLTPSLIDLRVGHILRAIPHPNADSLYVSTIACGDPPDTPNTSLDELTGQTVRTVCSGLNGLIPLAELQDRNIVAVCNLKPVTMRGIKSAAMVLAASPRLAPGEEDAHKGPVELVSPPSNAVAGERVYFEGWQAGDPEPVLNPKKKIWETLQPGFTTTESSEVGFDAKAVEALKTKEDGVGKLRTKSGVCVVTSLKGAVVR
ncbi:G4 quadruplex nucleic acid binding protein [Pseudocyphellaria aurata]|nr:G4 quadruplex nucleic acid binding protein [Pseudocyphellaria aurata]